MFACNLRLKQNSVPKKRLVRSSDGGLSSELRKAAVCVAIYKSLVMQLHQLAPNLLFTVSREEKCDMYGLTHLSVW